MNKSVIYKESMGGGYGINRNTGGSRSLPTAEPPLANVTIKPGLHKMIMTGGEKLPSFQGAKVIGAKK